MAKVVFQLILVTSILLNACKSDSESASKIQSEIFPSIKVTDATLPKGFEQSIVLSDLRSPSTMEFSPDGRLFIGERIQGELRVLMPNGKLLPEPVVSLDIPKDENGVPTRHNSSGIRGFTFDPDFPEEPYIYIFYMKHEPRHNRVSRFQISEKNPNRVIPGSEQVLIELPFNDIGSSGSHNGGALIFGEDDKLYITTGDGWRAHGEWEGGEPVQSLETMTGKVLRINRDGTIPKDNPFYNKTIGDYRAIYALGLRNPFSMSRHPVSQQIYINDASMSDGRPEKDHILKLAEAGNYRWERPEHGQQWQPSDPGIPQQPYARAGDRVITGGAWYPEDGPFPTEYHGSYFIPLWGANDPRPGSIVRMMSETDIRIEPFVPVAGDGMNGMGKPVYTKIGPEGNLYWLATTYETEEGSVFKISYTGEERPERLATPQIEPNGGIFPYPVEIRLKAQSAGQRLHYTLDGSVPGEHSPRYTSPFTLDKSMELKVRSFKKGSSPSLVSNALFEIQSDKTPAEIVAVVAEESDKIRVIFDEAVEQMSAEIVDNYKIGPEIDIRNARLNYDYKTVLLTTTELANDTSYALTVRNVLDRAKPANKVSGALEAPITRVADKPYDIAKSHSVRPFLNMPETSKGVIPEILSHTGIFEDTYTLTPSAGIIPYSVNTSQWNDGAQMKRWIALPNKSQETKSSIDFSVEDMWNFPLGTVLVRHVEMIVDEQHGDKQRLETQILVADTTGSFYGVTYKWRENGRDADLITESHSDTISILRSNGEKYKQQWRFDRGECMACHTSQAGYVLGVNTRQLNRNYLYAESGIETNQLRMWNKTNMFNSNIVKQKFNTFPKMVPLEDKQASFEHRISSYFDVNCGNCHRPDGVMGPQLDLRYKIEMSQKGLINGEVNNVFGIEGAKAIVPGDPERSIVYHRMTTDILGLRMPQFSTRIDQEAVNLLEEWIERLDS